MAALDRFTELVGIITRLRAPDGCAWDREQTASTVKDYILEESYELIEAVIAARPQEVAEECGDLLFLVLFLARIFEEQGHFTLEAVLETINAKMIRRHPHVFADTAVAGVDDILKNWETIKATEPDKQKRKSLLDGVPKNLPALARAFALQKKAAKTGFDWPEEQGILDKIREEVAELETEMTRGDRLAEEEELGDLLFSLVNLARRRGLDPESALTGTNSKFATRFRHIEAAAQQQDRPVSALSLEEMDQLWEEAKHQRLD
jgi:MazG family protein